MKIIEIIANEGSASTIASLAEKVKARDLRFGEVNEDGMQSARMLVTDNKVQKVLDTMKNLLGAQPSSKVFVLDVEAVVYGADRQEKPEAGAPALRESLYDDVRKNAKLNANYCVLVVLSTVVAAIGLIENNVAVLIGAMVIAPLLAPNLALSLGTALGNLDLVVDAMKSLAIGTLIAVGLSFLIGFFWPENLYSTELMARTDAGLEAVALALASGAAAALSMTSGLSSVLVGVMVAVALLPPAATMGIMLGQGSMSLALGAGLLLAINIVCVNLSSKIVFWVKGVAPRQFIERKKAQKAIRVYVLAWILLLLVLIVVSYLQQIYVAR